MRIHEMQHAAGSPSAQTQKSLRLEKAAQEFEAQMMKELLQPLNGSSEGSDGEDEGSAGALGSFSLEVLGSSISQSGGLGIAREVLAHISRNGNVAG
jgi:Rod binding domain-containing protein